jgi:hypothetical protein
MVENKFERSTEVEGGYGELLGSYNRPLGFSGNFEKKLNNLDK